MSQLRRLIELGGAISLAGGCVKFARGLQAHFPHSDAVVAVVLEESVPPFHLPGREASPVAGTAATRR